MKIEPKQADDDIELNMSPMIDMVFLLLIFFIVASQIIDTKPPVDIPAAAFAKVPEDVKGRLMLTVTAETEDRETQYFVEQAPVTFDELKEILATEIENDPNLKIQIRSDGKTKYKVNEQVMKACADVGANDLIYSAFEE